MAGELPYDPIVTTAQVARRSIAEHSDCGVSREITKMWERIARKLDVPMRR